MPDANVVKVITTNDLYDEVLGLREDVRKVLDEHRDIPGRVEKLEAEVASINKIRWQLTGAALMAGPLGALVAKMFGG